MTEADYILVHELTCIRNARRLLAGELVPSDRITKAEMDLVFQTLWKWEDASVKAYEARSSPTGSGPTSG